MVLDVFLVGHTGQVGRCLLDLLVRDRRFRLRARANRSGCWSEGSDEPVPLLGALDRFLSERGPRAFVDATASAEVAALLPRILARGVAVATPNKLAFSGPRRRHAELLRLSAASGAPLCFETTVGAGLPVLKPIEDLREAGDPPTAIAATLSGTLGLVLHLAERGVPPSEAIVEAQRLGYAEPDPWLDLHGEDVRRKLIILCRHAGWRLPATAVEHRPLLARDPRGVAVHDRYLLERAARARRAGRRLAYVARFAEGRARVGLEALASGDPLASGEGADNVIVIRSRLYDEAPLVIRGPGAGTARTAAGLHADLLSARRCLSGAAAAWSAAA